MIQILERKRQNIVEDMEYYRVEMEKAQSQLDMVDDLIDELKEKQEQEKQSLQNL